MSHLITETCAKYTENLKFNLEAAKARRDEIAEYIKQTEEEISKTDGRKKGVLETLNARVVSAKNNLKQIEEKIGELDSLGEHAEEIADLDDQISRLCAKRTELLNNNLLMHSYLKVKSYGLIWFMSVTNYILSAYRMGAEDKKNKKPSRYKQFKNKNEKKAYKNGYKEGI